MPPVTAIRKLKRPPAAGTWKTYDLGADHHGRWCFTPQGTRYRGERDGVIEECNVGGSHGPGIAVLHLIPHGDWWIATFWDAGARWTLTVDVCTPPELVDGVWTYIDLELDVLHEVGAPAPHVDDEDELEEALRLGHMPAGDGLAARDATERVLRAVTERHEPFATAGPSRLREALLQGLPPLPLHE